MTNDEALLSIPLKRSSGFSPAMDDLASRKGMTQYGSLSFTAMIPKMLSAFESYTANATDKSGRASIFYNTRSNPLMSFVYTSADWKSDEILKLFCARGLDRESAEKLLAADFTDELGAAVQSRGRLSREGSKKPIEDNDPDLRRVFAIVNSIRTQERPYADNVHSRPIDSGYADSMRKFRNCTKFDNPNPPECRAISALIRTAETGTAVGGSQSQEDRNIIRERDALLGNFDKLDAPNLIHRYREGEISLSELCKRLHTLSIAFEEYRQHLSNYASKLHDDGSTELRSGFREMKGSFREGLWLAQQQVFPLLLKETLEVRLAKIEETAKLLTEHESDFPGAKQELRQRANILTCQHLYPVGPAFDRIKDNSLPASGQKAPTMAKESAHR